MCIIIFAYDCHPRYKLVFAQNRDEFWDRPSLAADYWPENPAILAGIDKRAGGTWMGITTAGRLAALTNYRNSNLDPLAPSRGHLVRNYLEKDLTAEEYLHALQRHEEGYNDFNLLAGTTDSLFYFSNQEKLVRPVEPGIHGLSNSLLDVPWPKVAKGTKTLEKILGNIDVEVEQLFTMMADREQPNDNELPSTGIDLEWERILAPIYVASPGYGTQSTTILLVDRHDKVEFWERSFNQAQPGDWTEVHYEFNTLV